ncbi:MAG: methyltransferase domain-containing protein [Streptosporangiales bacterium]|nr:methyltransferase domain-containing protein [Streptosporangiales bacterium]
MLTLRPGVSTRPPLHIPVTARSGFRRTAGGRPCEGCAMQTDRAGTARGPAHSDRYFFDQGAEARIRAVEQLMDPGSIRVLANLVTPGARCLEVGAGGGSIVRWLCDAVGAAGEVVATDIDTWFLERINAANLLVRRHDIVHDSLEKRGFDLIHARLVLEHLPDRDAALKKLIAALRPGGWIVLEDADYVSGVPVTTWGSTDYESVEAVRRREFAASGINHYLGRELPGWLRQHGLVQVGNEGRVWVMEGGSAGAQWFGLSIAHLRTRLVGPGKLTDEQVDRMLALFQDPSWSAFSPIIMAAWGQAPT